MNRPEVILLAGGLGTRLSTTVPDLPKALAPVGGRPLLGYLLDWLEAQGIRHVLLALGHRADAILDFASGYHGPLDINSSLEPKPLGTGGAIALAMSRIQTEDAFVLNADTFFDIHLGQMEAFHQAHQADVTLALKPMRQADRYGLVNCDATHRIQGFQEKCPGQSGLINGGVYLIRRSWFASQTFSERFSFETDVLQHLSGSHAFYGYVEEGYFIDIGVPEDYFRAQDELPQLFTSKQKQP